MALRSYRELTVWQKAIDLVEVVYQVSASFPGEEKYGLTSQLRRAAVSVPSNIAEGNSRRSTLDDARFVSIALGSLAEIETQVEIAARLGYLDSGEHDLIVEKADEIGKMLRAIEIKLRADAANRISEPEDFSTSHSP